MTPKMKIFEYVFPDSSTGHRYVLWPNLVKIGRCEVAERSRGFRNQKNSGAPRDSPQPPFWLKWADRAQRCHPLTCPRIPNLVRIGCVLPDLFRKDWFFGPKSQYNIVFQPTMMSLLLSYRQLKHTCKPKFLLEDLATQTEQNRI